jgi:putative iron-dependent peroxidase
MDLCFELGWQLHKRLTGAARVVDETHGFKYFDERDLLGFVDGTENPSEKEAETAVTVQATDDAEFAGGSYAIVQKYLHDMDAWNSLTIEMQERAIGRTKLDDIETPDDQKARDAHTALNVIEDSDGNKQQILRLNMPFGTIGGGPDGRGESGTYFIGYSASPTVTETMLSNMFIGSPPGNTDRILDFSTALTGTLFFVPTSDFLDDRHG